MSRNVVNDEEVQELDSAEIVDYSDWNVVGFHPITGWSVVMMCVDPDDDDDAESGILRAIPIPGFLHLCDDEQSNDVMVPAIFDVESKSLVPACAVVAVLPAAQALEYDGEPWSLVDDSDSGELGELGEPESSEPPIEGLSWP
jgi:hypothetical protein